MKLSNQTAIVTGASRGIGKAIALALAREGCNIAAVARSDSSANSIAEEIKALGVKFAGYGVDISSSASVNECVDKVQKEFGNIDILINNAGITRDTLIMRMTDEDWDSVLQTNLKGAFNWTRAATKYMMKARKGKIINVGSVIGLHGNAGQANYAAAKAGLIGLTKSVAKELAGRNITCNVICPGFIQTDMTDVLSEELKQKLQEQIPLKRLGAAGDVAELALYLSCAGSNYMTGQVLTVDGGLFI
ncbi:MAG: 3-oxoacyl-[acyl-carrier-protein] reductase [Verrucomicrobiales bacterium]|jgi:3-oxoacyl-[acyl-carrier protein] reductase|nr:3-oxoacyl-[acyl-carrier-protein] reductase [Verrucomicrobiales bacterium]